MEIGNIMFMKNDIVCLTGSCVRNEPVQIIRIREGNCCDVINLRNELIYKIPVNMVRSVQVFP